MAKLLLGKRCVLTGATGGLGAKIAALFAAEGARLLLVGRDPLKLKRLQTAVRAETSAHAGILRTDLSQRGSADRIFRKAAAQLGGIDILINAAAVVTPVGPFTRCDFRKWQEAFQINFMSLARLCQLCAVKMTAAKKGGRIINISGGGAASSRPFFSAYAVAKTALVRFSEILADELKSSGVSVNCVAPGAMATAMTDLIIAAGPARAGLKEYRQALKLRKRGGASADRAAGLCLFLACGRSAGISGKLISTVWDPWETLAAHHKELAGSDIYTLRRILPADRGLKWPKSSL